MNEPIRSMKWTWRAWVLAGFRTQENRDACIHFVGELAAAGALLEGSTAAQGNLAAWFRAKTPAFEESIVDSVRLHEGIIVAGAKRPE